MGMKKEEEIKIEIITEIKKKKEFAKLDDLLIEKLVRRNQNYKKFLRTKKERYKKKTIKETRKLLRKIITPMPSKFYKKFEFYKANIDDEQVIAEILKLNRATRERREIYPWLATLLKTFEEKYIIDFGCGFNLLGLYEAYKNFNKEYIGKEYIGFDADGYVTELIAEFIKKKRIKGMVERVDITSLDFKEIGAGKENAVFLCLKLLDALEELELGFSKKILQLSGRKVISFSLKSFTGKRMRERLWFEKLLQNEGIKYEKIKKEGEVFYLF